MHKRFPLIIRQKYAYNQRKLLFFYHFPLIIATFLLYLQRIIVLLHITQTIVLCKKNLEKEIWQQIWKE